LNRLFLTLYLVLLAALGAAGAVFFYDAREEYVRLKAREEDASRRLASAEALLARQQTELERLRADPAYVERVIRRNLGYAKPDEYLFNFDQK
jgi:cell division protein FtsB